MSSYTAVIDLKVNGGDELKKVNDNVATLQRLINGIKPPRTLFDRRIDEEGQKVQKELSDLVKAYAAPTKAGAQFSTSIAGLNSQLSTFKRITSNAKVGSDEFNNSIIAGERASRKLIQAEQERLQVLRQIYTGPTSKAGARGTMQSSGLEEVYAIAKKTIPTIAGITEQIRVLETALENIDIGTPMFKSTENLIAQRQALLQNIRLEGQTSKLPQMATHTPVQMGPTGAIPTTLQGIKAQSAYYSKIESLQYKQLVTGQQIAQSSINETQQQELQNRLTQAHQALLEGDLQLATRMTTELKGQRIYYERINKDKQALMRPSSMVAGAAEPISGRRAGGTLVPGSPAAKAAEAEANRKATDAAVALGQQKLRALEQEAAELRKGTSAAVALNKQKIQAIEEEAKAERARTSAAVALGQQQLREEERQQRQLERLTRTRQASPAGAAKPQVFGALGTSFLPVTGKMPGGELVGGSPAAKAAESTAVNAALTQEVANRTRVAHLINSSQILEQGILTAKAKGLDVDAAQQRIQQVINHLNEQGLGLDKQQLKTVDDILNSLRRELQLKKAIAATEAASNKTPPGQGKSGPGKGMGAVGDANRMESLALGVGFPLMFGAGPASLAGSLAGSFIGSGFGGQILGGAIGQKLDEAAKAAADFSRSMREGGDAVGYLTEKLGYVNPETKKLIQNLQESGQTAKAAALAQRELGDAIGPNATKDLKAFGDVWDYVGRKFQTFTLSVTANLPKLAAQLGATIAGGSVAGAAAGAFASAGLQRLGAAVSPKETPETKTATEKTKELQDQLTIAKATYAVSIQNATLNDKVYITTKAQSLQAQKIAEYNKIIRDTENGKLTPTQKILEIKKLEVDYTTKARDLDKERLQLLDQRNQVALAQVQAGMQVGILQQQVQLAREQNTASDVRKASLQGQIGIQQALNNLETINLQIAQERAKTQKDINQNKIKELESQRTVANSQVDLAQAQAAQQFQQAQNSETIKSLGVGKERYSLLLEYNNLLNKETELTKGGIQALKDKYDSLGKEANVRRTVLNIEQEIELLQRPDAANQINAVYAMRRSILEKNLSIEKQITENQLKQATSAARMDMYRTNREAAAAVQGTARQITTAQIGIAGFGMGEGQKAVLELENTQQQRRIDLQQQYADKFKELKELIMSSSGDELTRATEKLTIQEQTYTTQLQQLTVLDALEQKQLALNEITRQYGPLVGDISQSISQLMTQGVADLVAGTTTAQQVFSDFLKGVGDALMKAAQQMIAQYLAIAAAKALAGLFGGGSLGGAGGAADGSAFGAAAFGGGVGTKGSFFQGPSILGRAVGGPVTGNTPYMVGERGPELFVPGSSGTIVPAGPTASLRESMGSPSAGGTSPVLNMTFETTRINGTEYVSREQLEAAMMQTRRQASADGARRGMSMTLDKLQQSPQTRSRVGIG